MAEDVREAILSRLEALMATISGVDVARNLNVDDDTKKTRIVILEGDETTIEDDQPGQRPANTPRVVYMHPQILLAVSDKSEDVGAELSALRGKVIQKITTDGALIALTLKGRGGRYIGMESDLAFGRMMTAQTALKYQFPYLMRPDQFA